MIGKTNSVPNEIILDGPLWENSSPTSTFVAQTVSMDLSSYNAVLIKVKQKNDVANGYQYHIVKKGEISSLPVKSINSSASMRGRRVDVTETGCTFTTGYSGSTANTQYAIPIAIYGIRGFPV